MFSSLRQQKWRRLNWGKFSSSAWNKILHLGKVIVSGEKVCVTEKTQVYFTVATGQGTFLDPPCDSLLEFPERNVNEVPRPLRLEPPRILHSLLVYTQPLVISQNYHLIISTCLWLQRLALL